ncbi:MAG: tetratricopeptide repeat protein [Pseudomonadota bacterium]
MKRIVFALLCCGILTVATACKSTTENQIKQAEAHRKLGEAHLIDDNYIAALREFTASQKLLPTDPIVHNDIGLVYLRRAMLPDALAAFQKALSLKPDYGDALLNLSVTYMRMEQWDKAIKHLKTLEADLLYSDYQNTQLNLGYAYYMKGDYANASIHYAKTIQYYEDGFRKDVTYVMALLGQARVALKTGKAGAALSLIDTALAEAPQAAELYFYKGAALEILGNSTAARNAYIKVIELAPQGDLSQKAIDALRGLAN